MSRGILIGGGGGAKVLHMPAKKLFLCEAVILGQIVEADHDVVCFKWEPIRNRVRLALERMFSVKT